MPAQHKKTSEEKTGKVISSCRGLFTVVDSDGKEYRVRRGGRLRKSKVSVLPGDTVRFVMSAYGDNGRMTRRL